MPDICNYKIDYLTKFKNICEVREYKQRFDTHVFTHTGHHTWSKLFNNY